MQPAAAVVHDYRRYTGMVYLLTYGSEVWSVTSRAYPSEEN